MIVVTIVALLVWGLLRQFRKEYTIFIFLIATVIMSLIVMNDVRTAEVFRENIEPDYDIVHYNSHALFPFVVQKHHNWSAQEYFHQVLFLNQYGAVVYETGPHPDQSEFMQWSLVWISTTLCGIGIFLAVWMIIVAELVWSSHLGQYLVIIHQNT